MSQLQLSAKLVRQLQQLLASHDEQAKNPGVAAQYLAAAIGFLVGEQDMPDTKKKENLAQLLAFAQHVADDIAQRQTAKSQQPAFGRWKPGDS